jgi:flotillin
MSGVGPFAQDVPGGLVWLVVILVAVAAIFFVFLTMLTRQYKRCPPNRVLVIYGKTAPGAGPRCLHGGAVFVVPLMQDYGWLALEPIRLEVARGKTASGRTIADPLPRVFSVAIGTTPQLIETAAVRLLGLSADEIRQHAEDIIVARLDRLIEAIEAGEVQPGTDEFYQRLESSIEPKLNRLGLVLINVRRE